MTQQSGEITGAQELADVIYAYAASDMSVQPPIGADAQMLVSMMNARSRQDFIGRMAARLLPSSQ